MWAVCVWVCCSGQWAPLCKGNGPPPPRAAGLQGWQQGGPASEPLWEGVCAQHWAQKGQELCERLWCIQGDLMLRQPCPQGLPPLGSLVGL